MPVWMRTAVEPVRLTARFRIPGSVFEGFDVIVVTLEEGS